VPRISIVIIGLKETFWEVALAVKDSLFALGYKSDINIYPNQVKADQIKYADINVFIKGHRITPNPNCLNILIQTEQLHSHYRFNGHDRWARVLDVFHEQASSGNSVYFPLGYSRHFDTDIQAEEIRDFHFFGGLTPHRKAFLDRHGIHYNVNAYGAKRDALIMSSSINVNIRPWNEEYYYAPIHGLLVMCKAKPLMQETVEGGYGIYRDYVIDFAREGFAEIAGEWRRAKTNEYALSVRDELMKNHRFEHNFADAVRGLLC